MTIYIFSGAKGSGKTTLARRIVGHSNVYDLTACRNAKPLTYPEHVKKMLDSRNRIETRIAIDGALDHLEVQMIREHCPEEEVIHYHLGAHGQTYEPTQSLQECALRCDYAVTWRFRA